MIISGHKGSSFACQRESANKAPKKRYQGAPKRGGQTTPLHWKEKCRGERRGEKKGPLRALPACLHRSKKSLREEGFGKEQSSCQKTPFDDRIKNSGEK